MELTQERDRHHRRPAFSVALLAAATLLLESALLRFLAVAQFYHFAFLVVSLALLGFGASGTLLSLSSRLRAMPLERLLASTAIGFAGSTALAYGIVNLLPFDSYSIAWERRQILYFALYYLALSLPFLSSGLAIGAALAAERERSHYVYAANLVGSGLGALLAPAALWFAGVPGAVLASALLGLLPAALLRTAYVQPAVWRSAALGVVLGVAGLMVLGTSNLSDHGLLGMTISPYKGLAQARRYPGARLRFGRWNAISRVDVMAQAGIRQLPGLSYTYPDTPPPQHGLSLDAQSLQPITLVPPAAFEAAPFMPEAIAFELRPRTTAVVLQPKGGLGVLQALAGSVRRVTAVVANPLVRRAVSVTAPATDVYAHPRVTVEIETMRVFLRRNRTACDVIFIPLTDAYQPVTSGAYSLSESYDLTVEALTSALRHLTPDGRLVMTRWLQTPPSESLRMIATLAEALEQRAVDPTQALVVYRGTQTVTALVQPSGWTDEQLGQVRRFATSRRYDLVWLPDLRPEEVNRFNRLPEPALHAAVRTLLTTQDRAGFYASYPFAVSPTTDDRPFFFHFFTWQQTPEVLATVGRTWQPFGGSGYFVLLALLALVITLSALLILAPLVLDGPALFETDATAWLRLRAFAYFGLLGLAFLFVEIPLIQRWILLLGHPPYAFMTTVLTILMFAGIGSAIARAPWLPARKAVGLLVILALVTPFVTAGITESSLGLPLLARILVAIGSLIPLAVLMGLPFPLGLFWLEEEAPGLVPWVWAINGCTSVVASVLAAIVALSYGFTLVLLLGAGAYAGAWLILFTHSR